MSLSWRQCFRDSWRCGKALRVEVGGERCGVLFLFGGEHSNKWVSR